jgi:predicted acyltransferase
MASEPAPATGPLPRLVSLDAYRGFIMLVMASDGFGIGRVAEHFPGSRFWQILDYQFSHTRWVGCSFWDLIQPSFMFMVGVAIPYSHASRLARGESHARIAAHVIYRALLLVCLGVFLYSTNSSRTNFTFVNVLAQIGLGYAFVYLLVGRPFVVQFGAAVAILTAYWLLFYYHPLPPPDFNYTAVGVGSTWQHLPGWQAHWDKNTNFAADFDVKFLNWFPQPSPFEFNGGGYQTLNFVPSMATMIFGLMAGELLRGARGKWAKLGLLILAAIFCLASGWALGEYACPLVKRIWTPSWAIFSSGWTFAMLAFFYLLIDIAGWRRWAFAFVVVGMNSIFIYLISQLIHGWIVKNIVIHLGHPAAWLAEKIQPAFITASTWIQEHLGIPLGQDIFVFRPILLSVGSLFVMWLACLWLYRRRIFLRI